MAHGYWVASFLLDRYRAHMTESGKALTRSAARIPDGWQRSLRTARPALRSW